MNNVLRTLIYEKQVSLTIANTTEIVAEGIRLHKLSPASSYVYGRGMSAMTYLSAALKEEKGEVSLSLRGQGEMGEFGASGNRALHLRGYVQNPRIEGEGNGSSERRALGDEGSITVVRDDGYNRPFVGSCAFPEGGDVDGIIEEYYRISEQLPTRVKTVVELNKEGECVFAGVLALQPLPFASEEVLQRVAAYPMEELLSALKKASVEEVVERKFGKDSVWEARLASYRCHCSREYLAEVLVTLGEEQIRDIIRTEGAVRVHCHYCNRDYEFTDEDANVLFAK